MPPALFAFFMSVSDAKSVLIEIKEHLILCLKASQIADEVVSKESLRNMVPSQHTFTFARKRRGGRYQVPSIRYLSLPDLPLA